MRGGDALGRLKVGSGSADSIRILASVSIKALRVRRAGECAICCRHLAMGGHAAREQHARGTREFESTRVWHRARVAECLPASASPST